MAGATPRRLGACALGRGISRGVRPVGLGEGSPVRRTRHGVYHVDPATTRRCDEGASVASPFSFEWFCADEGGCRWCTVRGVDPRSDACASRCVRACRESGAGGGRRGAVVVSRATASHARSAMENIIE